MPYLSPAKDGLLLRVHVQPRAAKSELSGLMGEALKIRLAAPPVDGKANKALLTFVAGLLKVPKSAVTLKSGESSREKTLVVAGLDETSLRAMLAPALVKEKQ